RVFVRYAEGPGTVTQDGKYVILHFTMHNLNTEEDGFLETLVESQVDPAQPYPWNPIPPGPFNQPGPVPKIEIRGYAKCRWTFKNGSTIIGVGPILVHVAEFKDGTSMLMVCAAYSITGGTGDYQDARGIQSATGASLLPKGTTFG